MSAFTIWMIVVNIVLLVINVGLLHMRVRRLERAEIKEGK